MLHVHLDAWVYIRALVLSVTVLILDGTLADCVVGFGVRVRVWALPTSDGLDLFVTFGTFPPYFCFLFRYVVDLLFDD